MSPTPGPPHGHLQLLLGLLRDAALWGKQGRGRWCDGDLGRELGGGRGDHQLWHVGQEAGFGPAGLSFALMALRCLGASTAGDLSAGGC